MTFRNNKSKKETLDEEREMRLVRKGSHGPECEIFELSKCGKAYTFTATCRIDAEAGRLTNLFWEVRRVKGKEDEVVSDEELKKDIEEALDAHGLNYERSNIGNVTVTFRCE